mgnify:CR=1 FL=1
MVPELRKEEILKSIKKRDISYIKDLAAELNICLLYTSDAADE